jgi:hypothetical protein
LASVPSTDRTALVLSRLSPASLMAMKAMIEPMTCPLEDGMGQAP